MRPFCLNIFVSFNTVMKLPTILFSLVLFIGITNCTNSVTFTPEHKAQTSGKYLYSPDELLEVRYEGNRLLLHWKGGDTEPVVLDENTFFVPDMYHKLRFVKDPKTQKRYLGIVSKDNESEVTYDYLKVADTFKTPSMYLKDKEYDKALLGFLEIQKAEPSSDFIDEHDFNRKGYGFLRENDYDNAIAVFKMNVVLHPNSDNVYDSLADAYLRSGDSLQAFTNYSKAYELNSGNERAQRFIESYNEQKE